jgi:hypothetical protein
MKIKLSLLALAISAVSTQSFAQDCDGPVLSGSGALSGLSISGALACGTNRTSGVLPAAPGDQTFDYASGASLPAPGALGLYRHPFNSVSATTATLIGAIPAGTGSVDLLVGLDNRPDGSLVGLAGFNTTTPAGRLVNVNASTGALTTIAAVTGLGGATEIPLGLSINPVSGAAIIGTFTPSVGTKFYNLNLTTGVATVINATALPVIVLDLSTNCDGQTFAIVGGANATTAGTLQSVNTTTGALSSIGSLGTIFGNFVAGSGFDFDNTAGVLYGGVSIGSTTITDSSYGSVNLTTGALTGVSLGAQTTRIASGSACPAAAITPATPGGAVVINSAVGSLTASAPLNFTNAASATVSGTVSCVLSNTVGTVTISPTTAITLAPGTTGGFTVTGSGVAGSTFSATVTCTIQGAPQVVYNVNGVISAVSQINTLNGFGLSLLALSLMGFGIMLSRRFN